MANESSAYMRNKDRSFTANQNKTVPQWLLIDCRAANEKISRFARNADMRESDVSQSPVT